MNWYLLDPSTNEPVGPYTTDQLSAYIKSNQVSKSQLAAPEGASQWQPLSSYPQFQKTRYGLLAAIGFFGISVTIMFICIVAASTPGTAIPDPPVKKNSTGIFFP